MTSIDNLTLQQVIDLEREAAKAGDRATENDCVALYYSYVDSSDAALSEHVDNARGEVSAIAERIVKAINDAEAQVES